MKKSKKKKLIRIAVIAVVLIIIILSVGRKQGWIGEKDIQKVSTELVEKRNIIETVSANGKIQPEIEVKISPDISGEVIELYVKEGDLVVEGDILAKIDPEIYLSNLDQAIAALNTQKANTANAKARLAQVEAQFLNAKLNYERNEKLFKEGVISQSEYDAAKANFEVAKAEVDAAKQSVKASGYSIKNAQAALKEVQKNLTLTTIIAPTGGTISRLNIEKGERVVGASQFSSGTEIMCIANLNEMEANVTVNENDIVRVNLGDTALIEVDAYLNRKFKGLVSEIATSANVSGISADQVTNFEVKIRILRNSYQDLLIADHPEKSPFRPGMSTTVDIQTETQHNILTIPIQAVTTRSDTSEKKISHKELRDRKKLKKDDEEKEDTEFKEYVFLYEDGIAKLQEVESGIQDNTYIQILKGLEENQEVIIAPYRAVSKKLKNGDEVKKVDIEDLFAEEK
ncbi:MAG: efflux RND transporter periplasmic adaptor subunit [Bacteroidales bacterium]|nr:efflux RND transporter periplasmic adaptor subunit [Bacteroidales bacterium]